MARPVKRRRSAQDILAVHMRFNSHQIARDAARCAATRRLVSFPFFRGDLHVHTVYSDGMGTVDEVAGVAQQRGLDFLFITDHGTVRQKVECVRYPNVWWGQEPGAGGHHICILDNPRKYTPVRDIRRDAERLRKKGLFFFYPHPTGWFPRTVYDPSLRDSLREAGPQFAMEVINGIFRIEPFHDEWTDANVALWDALLGEGFRVTGLAATDAHFAPGVGNVWTGVLARRLTKASVLEALRQGTAFASMGPAINVRIGRTPMGAALRRRGRRGILRVECADAYGLNWLRVVKDGKVVRERRYRGRTHAREAIALRFSASSRYVRAECAANDDRRAYSNPIYLLP